MSDTAKVEALIGIVREIESSDDRITSENKHKSEILKKAKADGFNVKALRKVISARRQDHDEREQNDSDFELYWNAVHGLVHAHVEIIEEIPSFIANRSDEEADGAGEPEAIVAPSANHQAETPNASSIRNNVATPPLANTQVPDAGSEPADPSTADEGDRGQPVPPPSELVPVATSNVVQMRKQWQHSDPPDPRCRNPHGATGCGGFSNIALCAKCKIAAGLAVGGDAA